ncbi:MAG: GNAT family N-acetyltransferase [Chloroflexi bacterium]|nr:GNAT family N-acetyltransferase [Chloroflexota bacterium]
MKTEVYTDAAGFAALHEEWNPLLRHSASDTIFLTWEWQSTWWEHLGEGELYLLATRTDGGRLIGIAPLYLTTSDDGLKTLSIVGCRDVSDYLDLITASGQEDGVYRALLDWLASDEAPTWDQADLCNIPAASSTHSVLAEMAAARGYRVQTEVEDVCPIIFLPSTWDEYLSSLDRKQRHELRRKLRKAEHSGQVNWYVAGEEHDLVAEMEAFIELHQRSAVDKHQFMDAQMKGFFHALAQVLHEAGWLQLAFIEINGDKAAAMLNFDYRDSILVYNSGFDPQKYAWLSPGIVLLAYCIQRAIELGRAKFDFMRGAEEYKFRFGGQPIEVYRLLVGKKIGP